jgi:hypothetical protein
MAIQTLRDVDRLWILQKSERGLLRSSKSMGNLMADVAKILSEIAVTGKYHPKQ